MAWPWFVDLYAWNKQQRFPQAQKDARTHFSRRFQGIRLQKQLQIKGFVLYILRYINKISVVFPI